MFFYEPFRTGIRICDFLSSGFRQSLKQCCGSLSWGSICFLIRICHYLCGSGFFHPEAKIVRKILISTVLWLFFNFEEWWTCKCTFKKYGNKQKNFGKQFFGILKVTDEKSWIRIRMVPTSVVRIRGSGSVKKFHGSTRAGCFFWMELGQSTFNLQVRRLIKEIESNKFLSWISI